MNGLEVDFLFRINFSLHVTPELFQKYRAELVSHSVGAGITPSPELQASPVLTSSTQTSPHIPSHTTTLPSDTKSQTLLHTDHGKLPFGSSTRHPMHITPSPPPPTAHPAAPPLQVVPGGNGEMLVSGNSLVSLVGTISHQQVSVLQRHNSLPVAPTGLAGALIAAGAEPPYSGQQPPSCSSSHPPFSAPAMTMPGTNAGAMASTEQYVVVDNVAYPVHGGMVHYQHAPTNSDVSIVSNSGGFHHGSSGQPAQVTSQRFVNGQMLAG